MEERLGEDQPRDQLAAGEDLESILNSRVEVILGEAEQAAAGIREDAQR